MGSSQMAWISASIGITGGCLILFFGKTADILGCRTQLISGLSIISFTALLLAVSPNPAFLITLCALMGLGIAAVAPPAVGVIIKTYPRESKRKKVVMGYLAAGNPLSIILGGVSSGIATKLFSWRAGFVAMSITYFFIALLALWTVPHSRRVIEGKRRILRQFDYLGTLLLAIGMALLSAALTNGPGATNGWKSPKIIVMLILGLGCILTFAAWEHCHAHPLIDPKLWRDRNFNLCVLCVFFGYMSFAANEFWLAFYMQNIQHISALKIAIHLIPFVFAGLLSYLGQLLLSKWNGAVLMGFGALGYLVASILLVFNRESTSYWKILLPSLVLMVLGVVFQFLVSNLYVAKHMSTQASLASGVLQVTMRLSVSMGLTITSAVYGTVIHSPEGQADLSFSYKQTYLCTTVFAILGLACVPFMNIKTHRHRENENQAITLQGYDPETSNTEECTWCKNNREGRIPRNSSRGSEYSMATSYFPRFSWEDEREMLLEREKNREGGITYEAKKMERDEEAVLTLSDFTRIGGDIARELEGKPGEFVRSYELFELRTNSALLDILKNGTTVFQGQQDQFRQRSQQNGPIPLEGTSISRLQKENHSLSQKVDDLNDENKTLRKELQAVRELNQDKGKQLSQRVDDLENENKRLARELQQTLQKISASTNGTRNTPDIAGDHDVPNIVGLSEVITPERDDAGNIKKDKYQALVVRYNDLHVNWTDLDIARRKLEVALRNEREKVQRWTTWAEGQEKLLSKTKAKVQKQEEENNELQSRIGELEKLHQLPAFEEKEGAHEATGRILDKKRRRSREQLQVDADLTQPSNSPILTPPIPSLSSPTSHHTCVDDGADIAHNSASTTLEHQASSSTEELLEHSTHSNLLLQLLQSVQSNTQHVHQEILVEPSTLDDPVFISARAVRKRKARNDTVEPTLPRIKVENISSSPIGLAAFRGFGSNDSVDLDEIGDKVDTPRKRLRTIALSRKASSGLQDGTGTHAEEFFSEDRIPLEPVSENTSQNTPLRVIKSSKTGSALRQLSPNKKIIPRTSSKALVDKEWREAKDTAIEGVGEGGEMLSSGLRRITAKQSALLQDLLERPSPGKHMLSPSRGIDPADKLSYVSRASPVSAEETPIHKQPTRLGTPKSRNSSIKRKQRKSTSTPLRNEPLRSRRLSQLGLENFKVNPNYNQGYDYAFSDVVRKQSDRRCLPGCTKPECCGTKFRKLAEMTLESPGARTLSQEEHNKALLEEFVGDNKHQLESMTAAEKDELLVQAKTRELANKLGRHRHAFERRKTPPGFWETDMPNTQEELTIRELAKKAERELVEQRYMEAMRPGGAYIFGDE
ncbi:hypothetical protein B7463_g4050, partial [Scytalidium lignicola]